MNFFGMGPMELFVIMAIALIVFGPGRMPEIGRNIGSAIREFRRASQELTDELTRETDLKKLKEEVNSIRAEVAQTVPYLVGGVTVELEEPRAKPTTGGSGTEGSPSAAQPGPALPLDQAEDAALGGSSEVRESGEDLAPTSPDRPAGVAEAAVSSEQDQAGVATASAGGAAMRRRLAQRGAARRRERQSTHDGTDQFERS